LPLSALTTQAEVPGVPVQETSLTAPQPGELATRVLSISGLAMAAGTPPAKGDTAPVTNPIKKAAPETKRAAAKPG
jgi:hypothetical protein